MIKLLSVIILAIIVITYNAGANSLLNATSFSLDADSTLKKKAPRDTTFIVKEVVNNMYHAVYIEKNRQAKSYKGLTNFSDYPHVNHTFFDSLLPKRWIPLYLYKNNYYVYAPSDWGTRKRRVISSYNFIEEYMDGPDTSTIISSQKANGIYSFVIRSRGAIYQVKIHVIDAKTNMAVWEFCNEKGKESSYQFYIPVESVKYFDIIVNYCREARSTEFQFDRPDFKKLLGIQ